MWRNSRETAPRGSYGYSKQIKNVVRKNQKEERLLTREVKGMSKLRDENISLANYTIKALDKLSLSTSPGGLPTYRQLHHHQTKTILNKNNGQNSALFSLRHFEHTRMNNRRPLYLCNKANGGTLQRNSRKKLGEEDRERSSSFPPLRMDDPALKDCRYLRPNKSYNTTKEKVWRRRGGCLQWRTLSLWKSRQIHYRIGFMPFGFYHK